MDAAPVTREATLEVSWFVEPWGYLQSFGNLRTGQKVCYYVVLARNMLGHEVDVMDKRGSD